MFLTHWGRVTHICISNLAFIGSDNGLSPGRRQAIIWTNDGIMLVGLLGRNFGEILIEILTFSFKKMRLKVSSAKRRPFCLGLNVLRTCFMQNFWVHNWNSFCSDFCSNNLIRSQICICRGMCNKCDQVLIPIKVIQSNSEFDEIYHYTLKKTDPITKIFCTFQDSCAVLGWAIFCDLRDVRKDINECTLIKFQIWSKSLQWIGHLTW